MSGEYNEYLAVHVLNEQQLVIAKKRFHKSAQLTPKQVSYRSLSRALKVHVNLAKQYDTPSNIRMLVTLSKQFTGCSSSFIRSKMQKNQAVSTQHTSLLALGSLPNRNTRPRQSLRMMEMWSCRAVRAYPTVLPLKLPTTKPDQHLYVRYFW